MSKYNNDYAVSFLNIQRSIVGNIWHVCKLWVEVCKSFDNRNISGSFMFK